MIELWRPLELSLAIAGCATALVSIVGIVLAYFSANTSFWGKSALEALMTLPLVLPPTVVGYLLLLLMGPRGWIGSPLSRWTHGYTVLFQPQAGVLAAAVVAFPLLYLPAKAAFTAIDRDLESVARLMGANRLQVFWHVSLPLARQGIASGLLLGFGRAIGEFGATTMVMGNIEGQQTLPMYIYSQSSNGELTSATGAVWLLSILSLIIILIYNRLPS